MSVKKLNGDAEFSRATKIVSKDRVEITRSVRAKKDAKEFFAVTTTFDFANVSRDDLLALALDASWISYQAQMRAWMAENPKGIPTVPTVIDVQAVIVESARKAADPAARARNAVAKLTPEQKKALLAELRA